MERHWAEQEVFDGYKKKYDLCVDILFLIEKSGLKEDFKEVQQKVLEKASGSKMMIDHMDKNSILKTH